MQAMRNITYWKDRNHVGEIMRVKKNIRFSMNRGLAVLVVAMGMAGCAGTGDGSAPAVQADPQNQVRELAAARWDALLKRDFARAYEYLSPGTREKMTLESYSRKVGSGTWKSARVNTVSCETEKCKVAIALEYSYRDIKSLETMLDEDWLLQDGKWWFIPRK